MCVCPTGSTQDDTNNGLVVPGVCLSVVGKHNRGRQHKCHTVVARTVARLDQCRLTRQGAALPVINFLISAPKMAIKIAMEIISKPMQQ